MTRQSQPNVIFITSDQHNAKIMGHKHHPNAKTPTFDRMAREGVRFDNAIAQCAICTPSRVSFHSGQYCHNHGLYGLSGPRPAGLPTFLGHFRRFGYLTGAFGKIHCPEYWVEDDCDAFSEVYDSLAASHYSEYDAYLKEHGLFELRDDSGFGRNPDPAKRKGGHDARVSDIPYEHCPEAWAVRRTQSFIEKASGEGRPFCVHCSLPRPHQWWFPSEPFWSMYNESELELPGNIEYDQSLKAPSLRSTVAAQRSETDWPFKPNTYEAARLRKLHGYIGCVSMVDHAVGELLDWLEKHGLAENTIVIYTTDHGDYACEHGLLEKAPGICSDAITRIPFLWYWKNHFKAGHVAQAIVESVDVSTTLCSLCGLEPMETSDGRDLSALLTGGTDEVHAIGVTEFAWSKSIRKGKYRYVYYPDAMFPKEYPDGFGELYDLEADPWEMQNLFFDPRYSTVIREMKDDFLDWLITTTRPVTVHGPKTITNGIGCDGWQNITRFRHMINRDGKMNPIHIKSFPYRNYL